MCTVAVTAWHAQTAPCVTTIGMSAFLGIGFMAGWGRPSAAASDPGRLFSYLLCLSAFIASSLRTLCACNSLCGSAPRNHPRLPSAGADFESHKGWAEMEHGHHTAPRTWVKRMQRKAVAREDKDGHVAT